jgi:prepilin-type N-terminal cleavage/methylation domain-containing protein
VRLTAHIRRDDGFTLVELLVVIVILALVVGPLAAAVIVYTRNTDRTIDRMAESHDAQIASAYFAQDVQSAGLRDWSAPSSGFPARESIEVDAPPMGPSAVNPCGDSTTPNAVIRFAWDDLDSGTPSTVVVSYVLIGSPSAPRELRRITCDATGTSYLVVAHNVRSTDLECLGAAGQELTTCDDARSIRLTLVLRAASGATDYVVTLVGQRRQT